MAAEEDPEDPLFTAPDAPGRLVEALTQSFPCLVVDMPRALVGAYADVLARADTITLVSDLTLGGLRDALRLKQLCQKRAPGASLALTVREPAVGKPAVSRAEFERGYGDAIDWTIPHQAKVAAEAAAGGKAMVSLLRAKSPHAKIVTALAERCVDPAGLPERKKRKWLW
jgi:pilus assembly protein CpaE